MFYYMFVLFFGTAAAMTALKTIVPIEALLLAAPLIMMFFVACYKSEKNLQADKKKDHP